MVFGVPCVRTKSALEPGSLSISPLSPAWLWQGHLLSPSPLNPPHSRGVGPEETAVKRWVPRGLSLQERRAWLVINHCVPQ